MIVSILHIACSPSLEETWEWDDTVDTGNIQRDTSENIIEETYFKVNATDYENWVYLALEERDIFSLSNPESDNSWDIGMQRYQFKLNSSIHGSNSVSALLIEDIDYEELLEAPSGEYLVDLPDNNEDTIPEYALAEWYDYDISTHILTPKESFYIIHNRNNLYFKFRILDYYDATGTPAMLSIEWEEILPPTE